MWRDAPQTEADSELDRLSRAFVRLADAVRPAIVQIRMTADQVNLKSDAPQPQGSRGSGFIIQPSGYILTAQHVIEKAKDIEIRLADTHRLPANVVASDAQMDLALLKVQSDRELPILALGDSDKIKVGRNGGSSRLSLWSGKLYECGNHQPARPHLSRLGEL
jgi:S1-C subfamily serine protease